MNGVQPIEKLYIDDKMDDESIHDDVMLPASPEALEDSGPDLSFDDVHDDVSQSKQWSDKEGWSEEYFKNKVLPKIS